MKDNNKKIENLLTPKKTFLIIAILLFIVSFILFGIVIYIEKCEKPKEEFDYGTLVSTNSDKENKYVKTTIKYISLFAEIKDYGIKYYYIQDINNHVMIATINDATYKKIQETYLQNQEKFTYNLKGYIFNIPDDVIDLAINNISESFDIQDIIITKDNYQKYFGSTYLNEDATPYTKLNGVFIGVGIILDSISIIFLILYISSMIKVIKYKKRYNLEEVKSELLQSTTLKFEKEKIYLTSNYIVSCVNGLLRITKYEDLICMYNKILKQYSITLNIFLVAVTKEKKKFYIANSLDEDILNEIILFIKDKNKNILIELPQEIQNI